MQTQGTLDGMNARDLDQGLAPRRSAVAAARLDRLRTKLLDLSTTNKMLSFRHPRASCLRVVDELPEILFESLLDGDHFTFEAVADPSRRELDEWHARSDEVPRAGEAPEPKRPDAAIWARHLGLNTDHDLPVETDSFLRPERHADRKIQTLHFPDELDARLRKIRAAGRTAIEESGANMLYMAFGFLEWRDQATARSHQAPLLLLPVELERELTRGGRTRTRVRWTGEELQPNLSLQKKLEEFNIRLPVLQDGQTIEDFLAEVGRAIRHKSDWIVRRYVTLGLFEFGKILLYLDLDPAKWPEHAPIDGHPLVRTILEGDEDEGRSPTTFAGIDMSPAAAEARDLALELVDRADGSQCEALQTALGGRNLVIEGPPGTGKSQTITNLVAAALAGGKTVLFVAEKLAALEVVRRRLRELGLGDFCLELHSHKTRKTEVLDDIGDRVKIAGRSRSSRDLEAALSRLSDRRRKLSDYIEIIGSPVGALRDLTVGDVLMQAGRARRRLGPNVRRLEASGSRVDHPETIVWADLADAKGRLLHLAAAFRDLEVSGPAQGHPWAGVSALQVLPHDRERVAALMTGWADAADGFAAALRQTGLPELDASAVVEAPDRLRGLDTRRGAAHLAEDIAKRMEALTGHALPRSASGLAILADILRAGQSAPVSGLLVRNDFLLSPEAAAFVRAHRARVQDLDRKQAELREVFRSDAFTISPDDLEEWSAALDQAGFFARFGRRWRAAAARWEQLARPAHLKAKAGERAKRFGALRTLMLDLAALSADRLPDERLGEGARDASFDFQSAIDVAEWAARVRSQLPGAIGDDLVRLSPAALHAFGQSCSEASMAALDDMDRSAIGAADSASFWHSLVASSDLGSLQALAGDASDDASWTRLRSQVDACAEAARDLIVAETAAMADTGLDATLWFGGTAPRLADVAARARLAASRPELLPQWLDFDRFRRACEAGPERDLARAASAGTLDVDLLPTCLDFLVYDALARRAFTKAPSLHAASARTLDALREEYRAIDAQVMELRRSAIAAKLVDRRPPEGKSSGKLAEITEMALVRHELAKQRRHIPIRQLVHRAGRAIQALKPCFMMGPLSVAQYIAPGTLKFDLVIMDEASQMRPEDAIGALARGGQAIIVGDTKQLPPTSFFDRIADRAEDEDEDEVTLAEDSKSILELASSIFDQRMLKWHYRSRHEALIAFSNRQFYKDELIVFPSPAGQADRFGIGWTFMPDGVATKGVNPIEARAVAEAAARFLVENRSRSLGVVAMNIKQTQRIADELAALADADPSIAKALAEAESEDGGEPFFVKNLENVQGDERDVIMISMTYGPSAAGGRTAQRFGPINQETGWRRLNVLFTRAKERMEIFSSMRSSDVLPKEGADRGPRALKQFLDYAETGQLGSEPRITRRDPDSDFEDAVLEGLRESGFDCVPQVGVANFFIDIGVRDPDAPDEFIAAVECDGAAYHSEKSARDRDRLRQEILENLGWNMIRIWSTDWFRDPNGELDRVSRDLKRLMTARREARAGRSTRSLAAPAGEPPVADPAPAATAAPAMADTVPTQGTLFSEPPAAVRTAATSSSGGISVDQARARLIDLRERKVKLLFPDADPTTGLLRKSMLDELLKKRPTDMDEFRTLVRLDLRQNTDGAQLKEFGSRVFDILTEIEP
jgi:very-short-patch-repair endonuclease